MGKPCCSPVSGNHGTIRHASHGHFTCVDGQIAIYTIEGDPTLTVDLMGGVYGIPAEMNPRLNERAINFEGVRVLDPLYLFQSKCHCLTNLPQGERQDKKHLLILSLILPEYFCELLQQAKAKIIEERSIINELKLLLKISNQSQVKQSLELIGSNVARLFPVDELLTTELPLIQKFAQMTLMPRLS